MLSRYRCAGGGADEATGTRWIASSRTAWSSALNVVKSCSNSATCSGENTMDGKEDDMPSERIVAMSNGLKTFWKDSGACSVIDTGGWADMD